MSKPNILVICTDQHHPLMTGYRGHPFVKTPNLDRLAIEGTSFSRAYCNSPVCTPSRMSFITGKYVHQIGSWFLGIPLDRNEMTWARRLDQAGIPSTMLGKMDFCGDYQDGGFTDYKIIEKRAAWNQYPRISPLQSRLEGYMRKDKWQHIVNAGIREDIVTDGTDGHNDRLGFYDHDRVVTDWAIEYIKEKGKQKSGQKSNQKSNQKSGQPWALYVGLLYPHWPFTVPEKYFNMYYPDNVALPVNAEFPNNSLHPELQNFQKALGLGTVTDDLLKRVTATYYGMITAMDEMVGKILDELKEHGLEDNTYIIYTSDHGESLGEHGLFYKQCAYEGSVGVPLIIKGPGIHKGKCSDHPVSLVDMYPTIMDMAGLPTEPDRPGSSWLPLAEGVDVKRPDYAFSEYHGNFLKQDWYMLVRGEYKYVYYANSRPSLFSIQTDPGENIDLALDPTYSEVIKQFEELLKSVLDPEKVSLQAKKDLGLIGPDGEDYTRTLTIAQLEEGIQKGIFANQPEFANWDNDEKVSTFVMET